MIAIQSLSVPTFFPLEFFCDVVRHSLQVVVSVCLVPSVLVHLLDVPNYEVPVLIADLNHLLPPFLILAGIVLCLLSVP